VTALYLGLISGTSMDGIDAVLLGLDPHPSVVAAKLTRYPNDLRDRLEAVVRAGSAPLDELGELNVLVGEAFAGAALDLLAGAGVAASSVAAIGSHGQTVRHGAARPTPFTWQIGDPSTIAERTGMTTVADFRGRDIAAGGQGAPLLPAFHAAVLSAPQERRAILNLGGIANLTRLCPDAPVIGFDSGPANCLLDAWCQTQGGGDHDADGALAGRGRVNADLLAALLDEPYFARPAPKSTGRELFDLAWLGRQAGTRLAGLAAADVQATLAELTARTVATALAREIGRADRLICCGGGVHNADLVRRLAASLPGTIIETTAAHGLDPDFVEAAGFAWLAAQTLAGRPGNLPTVTGASGARRLGGIFPGR
jgi:anhydro-N-acetylmuramic acid kinase